MSVSFSLDTAIRETEEKFEVYRTLLRAVAVGHISHTMVHGPPGVGKSYELDEIFSVYARTGKINWTSTSGRITPLSLYNMLYERRGQEDIVVLDDCDDSFKDRTTLNILKAATDTKPKRIIAWESTGGKPLASRFEYTGRVVILTNADMTKNQHLLALMDRMFFIPLQLTESQRVARVVQVLQNPGPGKERHPKADIVSAWIVCNHQKLGPRLTLRSALKALQLAAFAGDKWEQLAEQTLGM